MLGLLGAHRTGKTTLAKRLAEECGLLHVESPGSETYKLLGLDPAKTYPPEIQLRIQWAILDEMSKRYEKAGCAFIADRTPLDAAAYMLGAVSRQSDEEFDIAVMAYIDDCYQVYNTWFHHCVYVPPAIPYKEECGKPGYNLSYQEKIGSLILGLAASEDCQPTLMILSKSTMSLEDRLKVCSDYHSGFMDQLGEELSLATYN